MSPASVSSFCGSSLECCSGLCPAGICEVQTCKPNGVDPQAWLADVLARLPDHPAKRVGDLLPWNWCAARRAGAA